MKKQSENSISSEVLAAYLDGNATAQECQDVLNALAGDEQLRELLHISQLVDADLGQLSHDCEIIPMTAMAATCDKNNLCSLECEKFILQHFNIDFDEHQLLQNAIQNGWQKEKGTALHNIGRHLESKGLAVTRQYKSTIEEIKAALKNNEGVIVAVDGGELLGDRLSEIGEDMWIGQIPDHTVVVLSCDTEQKTITIFDPNSSRTKDTYPIAQFEDAWNDSKNYLVTINLNDMKNYNPKPIDLSDVVLAEDLTELREAIAENAHDVWAVERKAQGWIYGPNRDDNKKETPCMVAYSQLEESEKRFDRDMAMSTLKLVKKLGYDIVKREDTELYKRLIKQIRAAKKEILCPYCPSDKRTPIFKHDVFCSQCGHSLQEIDWSLYE